jgi:predicted ATPase
MHDGQFASARGHLEQAIAHYDPLDHGLYVTQSSLDPGVNSLSRYSWTLWFLGYPEQAMAQGQKTLILARDLGHVHSLTLSYGFAAILHLCCRDDEAVQEHAEATMALATQHDLYQWQCTAAILQAWYLAHHDRREEYLTGLHQAVVSYRQRLALYLEWFLALLAQVYGQYGQPETGLELLTEAFKIVNDKGQEEASCWIPELYRFKGVLLLSLSADHQAEAEACLDRALDIARGQEAKSWELRAAASLGRLWQQQGKRDQARNLLAPVYSWFTEGFDTADLQEAKALLDELA